MKLVDIVFVLTAAATTNAILIPANNDDSPQASGTSSQVSGPTNEPNPGTSEYWQSLMDIINSSIFDKDQQQSIDVVDPSTSKLAQEQPIDELGPSISEQDWKIIIDGPDPGIPEDWRDLIDEVNSNIHNQDQQQPIDIAGPSTSKRGRKRPADIAGPSTSKQVRKQPTDIAGPSTSDKYWQSLMNIISLNIPSQDQQQPMIHDRSGNTGSNQVTGLSRRYQKVLDGINQKLEASRIIQKKKRKEYYDHQAIGLEQQSALLMGREIPNSTYNPDTEKQLKKEYEKASRKVYNLRRDLRGFMKKHGLDFEEPELD
ncbi:hypothetical protein BATDEDRAFT_89349 [Batrachochytrium dendrobatidis JAM81]|uniref:Uncharacterized protein n=1 Tax=Batrachochytrium dendrobatidis (strain JAM81 / FGSC 10211) TaxID=684364 RepID=F4P4L4_BATDJ|nr:uncharacterized protein BATDEDRAFT_89349 [Batrachochytrium dendrobatidis JAM81]EGF79836.1 hypothetical protein BATDEDRAFT_89349 [Batrachochytrium dendrobatidis JAM81]|eukprot:XP_006679696.1 hypothetical protein BATDEDRAFT_89349 [Batrachochytrium dendrobatidis JAM81]